MPICMNDMPGRRSAAPFRWLTLSLWLALTLAAGAETRMTLQQAASRTPPDFTPVHDGAEVIVSGQVSSVAIWESDAYYLPIQDEAAYGLLLQGSEGQFQGLEPGDWLEARGVIELQGGQPVLVPRAIRRTSHAAAPAPRVLRASEAASFRWLGVLVTTESLVRGSDRNAGGDLLLLDEKEKNLTVLLPRKRRDSGPQLIGFRTGDRIQMTGIASQYCRLAPYDNFFQILIPTPAAVTILERGWLIQPPVLLAALILAGAILLVWWFRERRMAALRKQMQLLNTLGEEVVAAASPADILRRLTHALPALSHASAVGLYIQNRGTRILEGIHSSARDPKLVDVETPEGAIESSLAACFRGRALVAIPDTRYSPFFAKEGGAITPRSVLFVPMFAQDELVGVLELRHSDDFHYFGLSEQTAMQHLANQVATALKLQEQHSMREQLIRSEKLAAAGQLISDVTKELRSPLESIASLASDACAQHPQLAGEELQSIAAEARRASEVVARLVSFARAEQSQVEQLDLNALLSGLLKFRAPEWKVKGVEIKSQLAGKRVFVMGSPGQLEQVLLNLVVDAEKSAAEAREKVITVSSSLLANRVLVEISYPTRSVDFQRDLSDPDHRGSGALGLGVCRGIIQSHGGEFRVVRVSSTEGRFDVELPVIEPRHGVVGDSSELGEAGRQLTVLVVEPDVRVQRQLVQLLGNRGDRVVPVASAEEGADISQRLRFDLAICAVRLPGLNWVEFFERVRRQVGGFVLLSDGFDNTLGQAFRGGEGFVLTKPIDESDLLRICRVVEERAVVSN
jgi:signal transduction histidine kinase